MTFTNFLEATKSDQLHFEIFASAAQMSLSKRGVQSPFDLPVFLMSAMGFKKKKSFDRGQIKQTRAAVELRYYSKFCHCRKNSSDPIVRQKLSET